MADAAPHPVVNHISGNVVQNFYRQYQNERIPDLEGMFDRLGIEDAPREASPEANLPRRREHHWPPPHIPELQPYVVTEAHFTHGQTEPFCLPNTRDEALHDLVQWAQRSEEEELPVMWLKGAVGIGKSAIARQFAHESAEAGLLGACFFAPARRGPAITPQKIVPTLAYHLCKYSASYAQELVEVLRHHPALVSSNFLLQIRYLLCRPLYGARRFDPFPPPIVVLDGLDQLLRRRQISELLRILLLSIRDGILPIRLLIATRAEIFLDEFLDLQSGVDSYELEAYPGANAGIRRYIEKSLGEVEQAASMRGIDLEDDGDGDWREEFVTLLVERSAGSYLHAATALRYIAGSLHPDAHEEENDAADFCHPRDRIQAVANLALATTAPTDALYTEILSTLLTVREPKTRHILTLLLHPIYQAGVQPEDVDIVLGLRRGRTRLLLRALHSVLFVPEQRHPPVVARFVEETHYSFLEYLMDPARCRPAEWCMSRGETIYEVALEMARFLVETKPREHVDLRRSIAASLSTIAPSLALSQPLLDLLNHPNFRQSIAVYPFAYRPELFRSPSNEQALWRRPDWVSWPSTTPPAPNLPLYPAELTKMWADQGKTARIVTTLLALPSARAENATPTRSTQYDAQYAQIFEFNRVALKFLRVILLHAYPEVDDASMPAPKTWVMFGEKMTHLALQQFVDLGFAETQWLDPGTTASPVDYLADQGRCGRWYVMPEALKEELMMDWVRWLKQSKKTGASGKSEQFTVDALRCVQFGLKTIATCPPSERLLRELKTLDLAGPCRHPQQRDCVDRTNTDRIAHEIVHLEFIRAEDLRREGGKVVSYGMRNVVAWLAGGGMVNMDGVGEVIAFWKGQVDVVEQCTKMCRYLHREVPEHGDEEMEDV
ncbi:hypothetical protein MKEN_01328300 [Mycena kentingensis (nom. inval.)]|nr:hypothetical protein MKEN_01328300 [Mycena kentingensis (nom. inval.)]